MTDSTALLGEIATLERELTALRTRVDEDNSSFSALEQQIADLRGRLAATHDEVRLQETRLAEKKAELEEVERLERLAAYEAELDKLRKAREAVVTVGQTYLSALDRYDGEVVRLRKVLDEMRAAFGDDERVAAVATALQQEGSLTSVYESVVSATSWRTKQKDAVTSASNGGDSGNVKQKAAAPPASSDDDLSKDLKDRAGDKRTARILDYFK